MSAFNELVVRVAELERRMSRTKLRGAVTDVDAQKHRIRVRIGGTDDEPMKSPWIPYAQIAGALKLHSVPSVGQQMDVYAPDGVPEQALAIPMTWSDENPSPSQNKDEHVLTFGSVRITLTADKLSAKVGESEVEIKSGAINVVSQKIFNAVGGGGKVFIGVSNKDQEEGDPATSEAGSVPRVHLKTEGESVYATASGVAAAIEAATGGGGDGGGGGD
jgi:phage baseplate assembly protein V